ncbi:hypothetical protein [Filifactor villosus]|uniref:Transposase n=1 Tax=Filifactor villosus TaxID=29374 RepID=A0ABV9QLN4_9FIRM
MNKQLNLSILTDELLSVKTKKKEFLKQIDQIIPWEEWIELIKPFYSSIKVWEYLFCDLGTCKVQIFDINNANR